jgi:serine/threonine protein kinase/Tol biopolymer transport system component
LKDNNREQVKNIFQAVLERPSAEREQFLHEACLGDESLHDEVRELLESFEEDDSFFDRAAIGELAEFIVDSDERLRPGMKLGRYKIKSELGAGGMGKVFLAEDLELERDVALKILSPAFFDQSEGIRRFVQEAKSASALNHPNILTIHEIGQFEDLHFIATEYVHGETLRQKQKRLSLREIIEITVQTASALNAAHDAKIIHRDVKPENIMLRNDGLIKVLDFGLAKLIEKNQAALNAESVSSAQINTVPGLIMGTVAYMSPEQARGKATDAGTDIWSLGVCLYEMVAGLKPFAGETTSDIIASILKSEPPPLDIDTPVELNCIILKTLQKKRENRYQTIKDLLIDLTDLQQALDVENRVWSLGARPSGGFNYPAVTDNARAGQPTDINQANTNPIIETRPRSKNTAWLMPVVAALLLCIAVGGLYYLTPLFRQTVSFETMRFEKLTYTGNIVSERVAISPDGKYTVYVVQEAGEQSLWVRHIDTNGNLQIVPPSKVDYGGLAFPRDGNYVYYSIMEKKGLTALYRVPVLGGDAPRKLLDNVERPVTFSPDGARMAVVQDERSLMIANADGSEPRLLATASEGKRWNLLAWSPSGETIVATVFSQSDNNTYLVEVSVEDGIEKPIDSPPWLRVSGMAWQPDGSGLILSGRTLETKLSQLWLVTYPEGKLNKITNDLNNYLGLSLTADGKTIASIQYERLSNVWSVSQEDGRLERQVTFDKDKDEGMSGVALAPDGKIVYTARITGVQDLWIINPDGSGKRQLTFDARSNFSPEVSPDNRYIVFVSDRSGSSGIWRMDMDGGNPKQLTNGAGIAALPAFSPDGKWIIYQFTAADNKPTVWKVSIEGGEQIQLTDVYSGKPVISPDGERFACYYGKPAADSQTKIAVIPFSGGQPTQVIDLPLVVKSPMFRWSADGRGLIYVDSRSRIYNLWRQSLDNGAPRQLTDFKSEEIFRFDSADGDKDIALVRGHESSDVIIINNFK